MLSAKSSRKTAKQWQDMYNRTSGLNSWYLHNAHKRLDEALHKRNLMEISIWRHIVSELEKNI
jgi:hypothetical protein